VLERLAYRAPPPGTAVPLTKEHAQALRQAQTLLAEGCREEARRTLAILTSPSPDG
jgi:hypothetical protein